MSFGYSYGYGYARRRRRVTAVPTPASIVLPAGQWDAPYSASGSATGWPDGSYAFPTLNSTITVVVSGGSYTASGTPV